MKSDEAVKVTKSRADVSVLDFHFIQKKTESRIYFDYNLQWDLQAGLTFLEPSIQSGLQHSLTKGNEIYQHKMNADPCQLIVDGQIKTISKLAERRIEVRNVIEIDRAAKLTICNQFLSNI